uniref:UDP-glucose 4-epimerase n=1 Tax=Pithovirus LCPAC304 TaxID=2506594 RepID=A0A481Z7L4_9VIRU|nr:MAG: GDP-mannose 4,6 dehydratase [Pithovirus LCPAC304]
MEILVTGGAGYIGSHTCLELLRAGHQIVIVDNFATSTVHNYKVLQEKYPAALQLESGDLCDEEFVERVFQKYSIKTVIHFAAYKSVGESVREPLKYYENNIGCTLSLLKTMKRHHVHNLIFSSSAAVYGEPQYLPIDEKHPCNPQSPYGKTKYFIEEILKDVASSDPAFQCVLLRYFNPVGTDLSGILRENTKGTPENLMPYMVKVVHNNIREDDEDYDHLNVYGTDYDTKDGTGVRDYIHVSDLALGHLSALKLFEKEDDENVHTYNLGTGTGYSVWEMVQAMNKASGKRITMAFAKRRPGDVAVCYADATKAYEEMGWKATYDLEMMCKTSL